MMSKLIRNKLRYIEGNSVLKLYDLNFDKNFNKNGFVSEIIVGF